MRNSTPQVFAGGWKQIQHAKFKSSINSDIPNVRGLDFMPTGEKLWTINTAAPTRIVEYDMTTPWDITTRTSGGGGNGNGNVFDITTIPGVSGDPMHARWDYDGMTCYFITSTTIYKLDAVLPHRADTLSYNSVLFAPTEEVDDIQGIYVFPVDQITDKQKYYVLFASAGAGSVGAIHEYDMPSKGDLAGTVYSGNFINLQPIMGVDLRTFFVNPAGDQLYVYSRSDKHIHRFEFRIIRNISSVILTDGFIFTGDEEGLIIGMYIRPTDGKKLYVTGILADDFIEYDMSLFTNNTIINHEGEATINHNGEILVSH